MVEMIAGVSFLCGVLQWLAISVYVLVTLIKKELNLEMSLYSILPILGIASFDQLSIKEVLSKSDYLYSEPDDN
jgi:hypothetical protein